MRLRATPSHGDSGSRVVTFSVRVASAAFDGNLAAAHYDTEFRIDPIPEQEATLILRSLTRPLPWLDVPSLVRARRAVRARVVEIPEPHGLSTNASFLLDLVRFSAALMVVAAHLTHAEFPTGFHERQWLGDVAVQVFFVLSGFVIRHVTLTRSANIREYFLDRAARMYSVMLPAMALTIV